MSTNALIIRCVQLAVVVSLAVLAGFAAAAAVASSGHEILVLTTGQERIQELDDTPGMVALVLFSYLAGLIASVTGLVLGSRRLGRKRT